jgi:hypothetical protein
VTLNEVPVTGLVVQKEISGGRVRLEDYSTT